MGTLVLSVVVSAAVIARPVVRPVVRCGSWWVATVVIHRRGGLGLDMGVAGEQGGQPGVLLVGELIGSGVSGVAAGVERIGAAVAVSAGGRLHAARAVVGGVAGPPGHG
ncbi:hypothetical protein [Mycolicibacterium sarraceniae]|uniref:hypothetical protein n=1 Tax=Mycolicibacterium sarraceniae TaxID=1534348 RepID=UPI0018D847E2|nr:hypothetical protein [Mycolicibacterium sarraceniae]